MDIGSSIALFLALAIALMIMFCLVTKYFQYKVNKKYQEQQMGQAYSQVDEITQNSQEDVDGQYQEFLEKRKLKNQQKQTSKKKTKREEDYLFQTTQIQSPMKSNTDPIYGVSMLKRRLDGQVLPMKEQTGRSIHSVRSFRPERLQNGGSSLSSQRGGLLTAKPVQALVVHQFISKLISYSEEGISILKIQVTSLKRQNGKVTQKKVTKPNIINSMDQEFEDQLQVLGFQKKEYGCCKFKTRIEIPNMVENQEYNVSSLKTTESKESIDFSQYYLLKDKVQSEVS